ncbi:MAG TPA: 50S ribosomal protein L29 [Dehalococcoidia bacterium]|nr:50S ribosomal protein L29 [Dehalococcoidia bacterium]
MAKRSNQEFAELAALDNVRLGRELEEAHRQLFTLRLQVATRQLQNVKQVGKVRRKIARIKTLQRQRELGLGQPARRGGR